MNTPLLPAASAALFYLRKLQWQTIAMCPPLHDGVGSAHRSKCSSPGKGPLSPWLPLNTRRQSEPELLADYRRVPHANVGVVLGELSGIVSLDLDDSEAIEEAMRLCGGSLGTPFVFATSRGLHALYAFDPRLRSTTLRLGEGGGRADVLASRKLAVLPPSRHRSGGVQYRWLGDVPSSPGEIPSPPEWLIERCSSGPSSPAGIVNLEDNTSPSVTIPTGCRNSTLFRIACSLRRHGLLLPEITASLAAINNFRCSPRLDDREVAGIARRACNYQRGFVA